MGKEKKQPLSLGQGKDDEVKRLTYEEQIERIAIRKCEKVMIDYLHKVIDSHMRIEVDKTGLKTWCEVAQRLHPDNTPLEVIEILESRNPIVVDKGFKEVVNEAVIRGTCGAYLNFGAAVTF